MTYSPLKVYNALQLLRLTASALYDHGRTLERTHQQLAEDLKPLYQRRNALVNESIQHDLPGVICAIRQLQADAKAHRDAATYLQEKCEDAQANAQILLDALKENLKTHGCSERMVGDFSITLANDEVTIR